MRVARFLLAPVLAAAAVGVHFWINVPEEIPESTRDQGAKPRPAGKSKRASVVHNGEPRTRAEVARQWRRYANTEFEREPVEGTWGKRTASLVNKAVVVARKQAFDGAPEPPRVIVTSTECRTVRCRFVLRSPFQHELTLLSETLEELRAAGRPVWRSYETKAVARPSDDAPVDEHYLEVTVAFMGDDVDPQSLAVPQEAKGPTAEDDERGAAPAASD
jgi:hypothetical protein